MNSRENAFLIKGSVIILSLICFKTTAAVSQQTVGDLLSGVGYRDRGERFNKKSARKSRTSVPKFHIPVRKVKKFNLRAIKPPKTNHLRYSSNKNLFELEKITDSGIKELFLLVRKFKNSRNRGELWLRLAELYNEKAKLVEFRLQDEYDLKLKEFFAKKRKRKPQLNLKFSNQYYKKSINLYELHLRDFKKSKKRDQVLYYLGTNYFQMSQFKKGSQYYKQLSKEHPKSLYISEAQFHLGEYHFENESWKKALYYFKKVLRRRRSRLYSFSLYKASWCLFREGHISKALKGMEELVLLKGLRRSVKKLRLSKEGLKDLIVFYAESGDYRRAIEFYKMHAKGRANKYLERLAYIYADKGSRKAAQKVFKTLIKDNPNSHKAFDYQYQIVLGYSNSSKSRLFREELFSWIKTYGKNESWYRANNNNKNKEMLQRTEALIELTLRNYVLREHQAAQNSRTSFSKKLAESAYKKYLNHYGNSKYGLEMYFFYGELLYDSKKYEQAAEKYEYVAKSKEGNKYNKQAADNYILSLERGLPSDQKIQSKVGESLEPIKFDSQGVKFEKGSRWFLKNYPQSRKHQGIMFRLGRLYYLHNQFNQAIKMFKQIIEKYPKTKYTEYSANLLLDIYNLRGDYKGLEKVGKELLKSPYLKKSSVGVVVKRIIEKASFKTAQRLEESKEYLKSAEMFSKFARNNTKSSLSVFARFNAGINYTRAGALLEGVEMYLLTLKTSSKKKNKKLRQKVRQELAILYSDLGDYERAAMNFEYLGEMIEKVSRDKAVDYYFNAAVIWDGFKYWTKALKNYDAYLRLSRKSEKKQAYYLKGEIYRKRRSWTLAAQAYGKYLRVKAEGLPKAMEVQYKLMQIYKKLKKEQTWKYWRRQVVQTLKESNSQADIVWGVRSKLEISSEKLAKLKSIKIPRGSRQQKVVGKKLSLLSSLNKDLEHIVGLNHPEGIVGALGIAGAAHQHMAKAFQLAPLPKGLTRKEQKQYRKGIYGKFVQPQLNKSIQSFRSSVDKGISLDEFSEWYYLSKRSLSKLVPKGNRANFLKPYYFPFKKDKLKL